MLRPNVSHCVQENDVHYNPVPYNYGNDYLTFIALEDGTFSFTPQNNNVISYSTDGGETWTEGNSVEVNDGDKVMWKGIMSSLYSGVGVFGSTGNFDVQGNIMSLIYGDDFKGQTTLSSGEYIFRYLLQYSKVVNAENLSLPATTLSSSCYDRMFYDCTSLTTAPELPATTLEFGCYEYMFQGCTSLTTAPALPATTLAMCCYQGMFSDCTSLAVAPELPATNLSGMTSCYYVMFKGCTSLTTAPELPATTLATRCYEDMFQGCTRLTVTPQRLSATTLEEECYYGMFRGCTSLTVAPELPASTLVKNCYQVMFYGCTRLNSITCLATNISANLCTSGWVNGVAASGTFTKAASMTGWTTGTSGIPDGWTVQDAS